MLVFTVSFAMTVIQRDSITFFLSFFVLARTWFYNTGVLIGYPTWLPYKSGLNLGGAEGLEETERPTRAGFKSIYLFGITLGHCLTKTRDATNYYMVWYKEMSHTHKTWQGTFYFMMRLLGGFLAAKWLTDLAMLEGIPEPSTSCWVVGSCIMGNRHRTLLYSCLVS